MSLSWHLRCMEDVMVRVVSTLARDAKSHGGNDRKETWNPNTTVDGVTKKGLIVINFLRGRVKLL